MGKNTSYFDENFIKNYSDSSDKGYLEVDGKCSKEFNDSYNYLPFLPERVKIKKCQTHVRNFYDSRKVCCAHKNFKTSTKYELILKKCIGQQKSIRKYD